MLYDPKWEQKTTADPRSLASLIAWLEQHPADQHYNFRSPASCLVAQWLKDNGETNYVLMSHEVFALFGNRGEAVVRAEPWTFGAALERARAQHSKGL